MNDALLPVMTVETLGSTVKDLAVLQIEDALDALRRDPSKLRACRGDLGPFPTSFNFRFCLADVSCLPASAEAGFLRIMYWLSRVD